MTQQRDGAAETSRNEQITSCLGSDGQHARRSCKHCKACAKHAHAPPPRARTRLHKFHSVGISHRPVPVQCNNDLKQQRDGAAETLTKPQITSCLGRTGQHARPSRKHCKACAKHAHAPSPRARTRLHKFHSVGVVTTHHAPPLRARTRLHNYF